MSLTQSPVPVEFEAVCKVPLFVKALSVKVFRIFTGRARRQSKRSVESGQYRSQGHRPLSFFVHLRMPKTLRSSH